MKRPSLSGWKDPQRRPRFIIWSGAALLGVAALLIAAIGATSNYWFCSSVCHMVMDDAIVAYNNSAHANIGCLQCHTHIGVDPVNFLLHKAEFGIDGGYKVLTKTFEFPLNKGSKVAFETVTEQCTQCHSPANRKFTPSNGVKIDHEVHKEHGVACTLCHNRIAHREIEELTLAGNVKHEDFGQMEACFRCHSQEAGGEATGECSACHTPDFKLTPASHDEEGFYTAFGDSSGHAKLAREDRERLAAAKHEAETEEGAEEEQHSRVPGNVAYASEASEWHLSTVAEVSYCGQCHAESFCSDCHGLDIPHPEGFSEDHGEAGTKDPAACGKCHASSEDTAGTTRFCSDCHHKVGDVKKAWFPQHPEFAHKDAKACVECHTAIYCESCHISGKPKVAY